MAQFIRIQDIKPNLINKQIVTLGITALREGGVLKIASYSNIGLSSYIIKCIYKFDYSPILGKIVKVHGLVKFDNEIFTDTLMIEDSSKEEAERLGVKVSISSDTLKKNEEFFQIF